MRAVTVGVNAASATARLRAPRTGGSLLGAVARPGS